jgi:hypothetical protein
MTANILNLNTKTPLILGMALSVSVALTMPNAAFAVDAVGGSAKNTDVIVNSNVAWTVLGKVTFQNPTQRYCTATGSADARNPGYPSYQPSAAPWQYRFTVSNRNNPPLDQGQERTLEFWNQFVGGIVKDNQIKEITTTGGWMANVMADPGYFTFPGLGFSISSGHTIYFLARKIGTAPDLRVLDNSLTVTCTDNKLVKPIGLFPPVILTQ